jgi:hypothetical protein
MVSVPWGHGCWWGPEIEWPWRGQTKERFARALWEGDVDWLDEHYGCDCCCHEHTHEGCAARAWNGCRGQYSGYYDEESWAAFYEATRGMTRDEFFGFGDE